MQDVHWAGVRFCDLLAAAQPSAAAHALTFVSAEQPYVDSLTLEQARLADALLAYAMDGKPLSRAHGAPVRVVIPEMYGYKNVKWVAADRRLRDADTGYWEQRGYDRDAWVGRSNGYYAPLRRAVHPHRAGAALGARVRVPRPARLGARPLPAGSRRLVGRRPWSRTSTSGRRSPGRRRSR